MRDKFAPLLKWHFRTFILMIIIPFVLRNFFLLNFKLSFPSPLLTLDGGKLLQLSADAGGKKAICYILSEKEQNKRYE